MIRARGTVTALAATVTVLAVTGCGVKTVDPATLLPRAKVILDTSASVHVTVKAAGVPASGTVLVAADGVAAPPSAFQGTVTISQGAFRATVPVISVGGVLYAQLPLTTTYTKVDPAQIGVGDPAGLLDPTTGVSALLTGGTVTGPPRSVRVDGKAAEEVTVDLPGALVDRVLALADPAATVRAVFDIDPTTARLVQASLTGPFYAKAIATTYTITFDHFGDQVTIVAPTG